MLRIMGNLVPPRPPIVVGVLAILLAAGGAGATSHGSATAASADAYAVSVVAAGGGGGTRQISAPPRAVQFAGGFAYPSDGSAVATGSISASVSATAEGSKADAVASADVKGISLFGGEVTVARVTARAAARGDSGQGSGDASGSGVSGLVVLGQPVAAAAGARIALGDWGYAVSQVQGLSPSTNGYHTSVTGLEIHVTADHGALPAGSTIVIGYANATATAVRAATPPPPPPPAPRAAAKPQPPSLPPALSEPPAGPPPVRAIPPISPKLTHGGYVFPVYGLASFGRSFGAPRPDVSGGWHHGVDIFAPEGAPLLAVADGTLFQVGWNPIGGNRLWLRDRQGNEFYYAHLSAYSPLAVDGANVRAGAVIGFVGHTGDAEGTPPHLHFEIHPVGLLSLGYDGVVDPYPALVRWQHLQDIRFHAGGQWLASFAATSDAPTPGAFLLSSSDISSASGLAPSSLARVLRPYPSAGAAFEANTRSGLRTRSER
jgi:murein DD-endopeptidase MepM/ murein hydrolase activator NlpD